PVGKAIPFVAKVAIPKRIAPALEHWAGDYTFKNAFLGSSAGAILFGIATLATKGIALPTGLHMAWNFGLWCFGFNFPGIIWQRIIEKESEAANEPFVWMIYLTVMGLSILGFYLYGRKKNRFARHITRNVK
ncbi:MAG: hypothetical protein AAFX53_16435, partial [Bacteroidota bacterium]